MKNSVHLKKYDCSLDSLIDGNYRCYQDDDIVLERLEPIFGTNPYKRKPKDKPFEWERLYGE